jgi:hypothetical protein
MDRAAGEIYRYENISESAKLWKILGDIFLLRSITILYNVLQLQLPNGEKYLGSIFGQLNEEEEELS